MSGSAKQRASLVKPKNSIEINEHYLETYGNHEILSAVQVKRLIRQTWEGNPRVARKAKEKLVLAHQRLVISLALKHQAHGIPPDDLIQEGNIGLLRAIDKFDPSRGMAFGVYAIPWIRDFILRAILKQSTPVYVPVDTHKKALRVRRIAADLSQGYGREATLNEVVEETGGDLERDLCEFALSPNFYGVTYLDELEDEEWQEMVDENSPDPQDGVGLRVIK